MRNSVAADVCEVCGVTTHDLGHPLGYPAAFLRCCNKCRMATPAERVRAWCEKVRRYVESKESKR